MKKLSPKTRFRVTFLMICAIISFSFCIYCIFTNVSKLVYNLKETNSLTASYNEKLEEEDKLMDEINKLKDPDYMARYAREKYLYSANDEIIIKIEE